jgi:D-alanyl-lipoteichoic acid acyltransferase DltB (MBOAT superfamily)
VNVLIVFLISGLWHGASWMFVMWGAIHGLYQLYEKATFNIRDRLWKSIGLDGTWIQSFLKWSVTMSVVLISWVFFRAGSLSQSLEILQRIIVEITDLVSIQRVIDALVETRINDFRFVVLVISIFILEIVHLQEQLMIRPFISKESKIFLMSILLLSLLLFGSFGMEEFIYFQF